jgi:hypothetical protein
MRALLQEREVHYTRAEHQVATDSRTQQGAAAEVVRIARASAEWS